MRKTDFIYLLLLLFWELFVLFLRCLRVKFYYLFSLLVCLQHFSLLIVNLLCICLCFGVYAFFPYKFIRLPWPLVVSCIISIFHITSYQEVYIFLLRQKCKTDPLSLFFISVLQLLVLSIQSSNY